MAVLKDIYLVVNFNYTKMENKLKYITKDDKAG